MRYVVLFFLLLINTVAGAQQTPPVKLLELETAAAPSVGSWEVAGETTLFVSGMDSARVYFGSSEDQSDLIIIGKVNGQGWVRAGIFGWFPVSAMTLAEYNDIQDSGRIDWNYLNFHPFELAFTIAYKRDGEKVLPEGAVVPRWAR